MLLNYFFRRIYFFLLIILNLPKMLSSNKLGYILDKKDFSKNFNLIFTAIDKFRYSFKALIYKILRNLIHLNIKALNLNRIAHIKIMQNLPNITQILSRAMFTRISIYINQSTIFLILIFLLNFFNHAIKFIRIKYGLFGLLLENCGF